MRLSLIGSAEKLRQIQVWGYACSEKKCEAGERARTGWQEAETCRELWPGRNSWDQVVKESLGTGISH